MKQLYTILSLFICPLSVYSQNNVFVLVDVSKSVTQNNLNDAKKALTEVFTGGTSSVGSIIKGTISDLYKFKLNTGDNLSVSRFGSCQTTWAITPSLNGINNFNTDVTNTLNSISWSPTDNNTFISLAKAKIAEYAVRNSITNYKLIIITDNIQTDFAKGILNYCNTDAKALAESYKSGVIEGVYTSLKFSPSADFTIHLIQSVDVSKYTLPGVTPPTIIDTENPVITITSPPEAKKGNEHEVKTEAVTITWNCPTCPQGTKYTVLVSQYDYDGKKFRDTKKCDLPTATFPLPDGKYRITVSASNIIASSDYTCISVSTGGYGWLLFLLILIVGGAVAYYIWNKKRQEKIDVFTNQNSEDPFSAGSGGAQTGNSSKPDYF